MSGYGPPGGQGGYGGYDQGYNPNYNQSQGYPQQNYGGGPPQGGNPGHNQSYYGGGNPGHQQPYQGQHQQPPYQQQPYQGGYDQQSYNQGTHIDGKHNDPRLFSPRGSVSESMGFSTMFTSQINAARGVSPRPYWPYYLCLMCSRLC